MLKTKLHLEQILVEYGLKIARPMAPPGRSIRPHSFLAMSERKNERAESTPIFRFCGF